jgi:hypothetical protein
MAASGFTPISLYYSTTASAVPTSGNLANGELGLNIADMKLYAKNSAGVVTLLASNAATTGVDSLSFGSTGLTPSTATTGAITVAGTLNVANGGTGQTSFTANRLLYGNGTSGLNSSAGLTFDGTTLSVTGPLNLAGTGTFPTSGLMLRSADNQLKVIAGSAGIAFAAASGASTYGMFDSAGNLGLGVTPSAWKINYKAFQLGPYSSGITSLYTDDSAGTNLVTNSYFSSTGELYVNTGFASKYKQNPGGGHLWLNAPSGTAGTAVSFTQAMTLDASGNLGVGGTASAIGAYRVLDLNHTTGGYLSLSAGGTRVGALYSSASATGLEAVNTRAFMQFLPGGTERFRIGTAGQLGIGGATYGTSGQVLTSGGASAAPTWATAASGAQAFVAFGTTGGF